jgi:hypothetical protein
MTPLLLENLGNIETIRGIKCPNKTSFTKELVNASLSKENIWNHAKLVGY